jgi:hypothetical protein
MDKNDHHTRRDKEIRTRVQAPLSGTGPTHETSTRRPGVLKLTNQSEQSHLKIIAQPGRAWSVRRVQTWSRPGQCGLGVGTKSRLVGAGALGRLARVAFGLSGQQGDPTGARVGGPGWPFVGAPGRNFDRQRRTTDGQVVIIRGRYSSTVAKGGKTGRRVPSATRFFDTSRCVSGDLCCLPNDQLRWASRGPSIIGRGRRGSRR